MTQARMEGERWLSAALTGGLPEPNLTRWQPLRIGIVNLWEYDNAEFWFADGRLVLRGGNGAGKTKVLELTTLMLLRGEIAPSALDPFGSQHRTMRFNLLPTGEGDDPRPMADSGLGYAWAEFGRRDEHGQTHYFVCGMGASARRGTGTSSITPWQLTSQLRPGHDFHLSSVDRPLDAKELKKVGGVEVLENAGRYRARLAADLFGLSAEAYDNLTELLKQLRKPKLGEKLNPTSLAETLRAALPPLAGNEINQLAEGWDRLERLRDAVDETKTAALHVARFVRSGWLPWVRVIVRRRADAFSSATTVLDDTTKARRAAETALQEARDTVKRLDGQLSDQKGQHHDLTVELRELLDSQAFQDARTASQRVETLASDVKSLQGQHERAEGRAGELRGAVNEAAEAVAAAQGEVEEAEAKAGEWRQRVEAESEPAGLVGSARRHLSDGNLPALRADLEVRAERFTRLRQLNDDFAKTRKKAEDSARIVHERAADVKAATEREAEAQRDVESAVDILRQQIREWATATSVAVCTDERVEAWCDLVAELTVDDSASTVTTIRAYVEAIRESLRNEREALRARRNPLASEREIVTDRLAEVRVRTEESPAAPILWRRRERPDLDAGTGAPLWQCVRPVDGITASELDLLEATLAAAGLLDAWLSPDGKLSAVDDMELADVQLRPPSYVNDGSTLSTVLEPTPVGGVPDVLIRSVLAGIGWHQARPATDSTAAWLAADGSWRLGPVTGRAEPVQPASYLGAAAREAARQREIARLTARLDELNIEIAGIEGDLETVTSSLSTLDEEVARIPKERPVTDAVSKWRERQDHLESCRNRLTAAQEKHRENEIARDESWAIFADYAGLHAFPLHGLDDVASALTAYRSSLGSLASALHLLGVHESTLATARQTLRTQQRLLLQAETEVGNLATDIRQAQVRLRTAQDALGTDHQKLLARRDELDTTIAKLDGEIGRLGDELGDAKVAASKAEDTLATHEERRQTAELNRDAALAAWWETFDAGLAQPLGLIEPDRRNVTSARDTTVTARREITVTADEQTQDRTWRRCYTQLEELRQTLLPNREAKVIDDIDGGTLPKVVVLADSATGWQPPREAADALAERVREQEDTFDAEQQRVLTTLLGSTFIEHLKDRLDYTERTFIDINKQLEAHPTRHGHAVRLTWDADPTDPDTEAVVTALRQGYQQLSTSRQEMVRSFLARKIDAARADASADGVADWKEQLSAALDYRSWLKIALQYRPGSTSKWVPFDSAKHGAKSGGEKVVLLSQPLFAAAVVAYNAASDTAPRWVWLDEAMTGVDDEIKASFMGLTVSFDLDVMLTAHDEWCKYSTVPAVAVYDLARQKGLPGVDAMPYLWCGGEWTRFEPPVSTARKADDYLAAEGLFATMEAE